MVAETAAAEVVVKVNVMVEDTRTATKHPVRLRTLLMTRTILYSISILTESRQLSSWLLSESYVTMWPQDSRMFQRYSLTESKSIIRAPKDQD